MSLILGEWREGKVRPLPGNAPHDRLVSRGISLSLWSICDDPFLATRFPQPRIIPGPSVCVFQAWRNLSLRCGQATTKSWVETEPPPASRPRAQAKERAGRNTLFSSSAMSSGRLFLDRVGRHQSPSPLHRHEQINTRSSQAQAKHDISTLPRIRHFYFALTDAAVGLAVGSRISYSCVNPNRKLRSWPRKSAPLRNPLRNLNRLPDRFGSRLHYRKDPACRQHNVRLWRSDSAPT
jgi:hypothetical protein